MSEVSNVRSIHGGGGIPKGLAEVMQNGANGLARPDGPDEGVRQRTAGYIRAVWPENTVKHLAAALDRKSSLSGARAIVEGRQTITTSDALRLSRHPSFGRRFILHIFDYPETPDYSEFLEAMDRLRDTIADV